MPPFIALSTPHERRLRFYLYEVWGFDFIPHWTLTYAEQPVTDTEYIDPSITVDIFGRITSAASKEVGWAVDSYKQEPK